MVSLDTATEPTQSESSHPLLVSVRPTVSGRAGSVRPAARRARARRWARRAAIALGAVLVVSLGTWVAVHRVPWLGPALADGLRAVLGPGAVAWMEDTAYAMQDRVDRWRYKDAAPKTFWEVPPDLPTEPASEAPAAAFRPARFEPPYQEVATPVDGLWLPIGDPEDSAAEPAMFKALVHPDRERGFAALAVIAVDTRAFDLHLVAGAHEPFSHLVPKSERTGTIPAEHAQMLFAAFNGGFKATHGLYGMYIGGKEYLPPRDIACTLARFSDGSMSIATWPKMAADKARMLFFRQTPPCLVEDGEIHELLKGYAYATKWGSTVAGDTIIRRSAIGLSKDRRALLYGLGDAMTAQAIARGMLVAGAHWVAELDVNYSYPRFLFFERSKAGAAPVASSAIIPGIDFTADEYVTRPSVRDFFYLTRARKRAGATPPAGSRLARK